MGKYQEVKKIVRSYFDVLEREGKEDPSVVNLTKTIKQFTSDNYLWRGVYPWRIQESVEDAVEKFWSPFMSSVKNIQRRQDIFIGGTNEISGEKWVMSMGHFMGLFDREWMGIRPTGKMISLRYAEFNCVEEGRITQTGIFVDIVGFMIQAGVNPLPPSTGQYFIYPGPRTHDGLLFEDAPEDQGATTLQLLNDMVNDLSKLNESGSMGCPPELLERTWHKDMIWYGPAGIGASYTIPRYQLQHQLPFRENLEDKKFNGHVCRFAEGNFACFFGWPNLSNTPKGGFLGLPGGKISTDMQVVDVYSKVGDKLSENWVFIDIPFWLKQQGLDIFERTSQIMNPKFD